MDWTMTAAVKRCGTKDVEYIWKEMITKTTHFFRLKVTIIVVEKEKCNMMFMFSPFPFTEAELNTVCYKSRFLKEL